jgi:hypothetical protein
MPIDPLNLDILATQRLDTAGPVNIGDAANVTLRSTDRVPPAPVLGLTVSPRLKEAANLAESGAGVGFYLTLDTGLFGFQATVRLLDGLFDALESHFEGEHIAVVLTCPYSQIESLKQAVIRVPRLNLRFEASEAWSTDEPELADLTSGAVSLNALKALAHAAYSEWELTLVLTPTTFPIKPFSAQILANACKRLSWHDVWSPLAAPRRAAPLAGPALISRDLAAKVICRLRSAVPGLGNLGRQARDAIIFDSLVEAELGFWAPERVQDPPCLIRRSKLEEVVWPWEVQPWKSQLHPLFLWVDQIKADQAEQVLRIVYDTLYR